MQKTLKYTYFIILGFLGALFLVYTSEIIGFSRMSFFPLSGPSYAIWVYPVYLFLSFFVCARFFVLPKKINYIIAIVSLACLLLLFFIFEGSLFNNPVPFGIGAR